VFVPTFVEASLECRGSGPPPRESLVQVVVSGLESAHSACCPGSDATISSPKPWSVPLLPPAFAYSSPDVPVTPPLICSDPQTIAFPSFWRQEYPRAGVGHNVRKHARVTILENSTARPTHNPKVACFAQVLSPLLKDHDELAVFVFKICTICASPPAWFDGYQHPKRLLAGYCRVLSTFIQIFKILF
jgi:hypothetical protein